MQTLTGNISNLTTEELLDEVVRRSDADGPSLEVVERVIIRARLADCDRRDGDGSGESKAVAAVLP